MPEPTRFRCPICRCRQFEIVSKGGGKGATARLPVYCCCGCSVLFRDPAAFTAFEPDRVTASYKPGSAHKRS